MEKKKKKNRLVQDGRKWPSCIEREIMACSYDI